ncbi:hypothetical protein ACKVMT_13465 [Halobacteriales archaeon Cl-PHB]
MHQSRFVTLGLACFGLILGSFLVRGTTRIVVGDRTAVLLAAPLALTALGLLLVLLVVSLLAVTGVRPLEGGEA